MSKIYFYDVTELDKKQLGAGLQDTDHDWTFVEDKIALDNLDPETEVISVFVTCVVDRAMIEALPKLKLIACRSTGFNNVDLVAAAEHNVEVVNVPTYGESTVAEYAFAMLLSLTRKIPAVLEAENNQYRPTSLTGSDLAGKTLGVVGTGHIGRRSIEIGRGFSMNVIASDPYPNAEVQAMGVDYMDFKQLLQQSDVVTLHVPYTPDNHHMINEESTSWMKQGSILVNTSRGELIDTPALIKSLDNGHLAGAAIDTIEGEALLNYSEEISALKKQQMSHEDLWNSVEISILEKMPNVIISPHNAYNTVEAIGRINHTTTQNIIDFWYGNVPHSVHKS